MAVSRADFTILLRMLLHPTAENYLVKGFRLICQNIKLKRQAEKKRHFVRGMINTVKWSSTSKSLEGRCWTKLK